MMCGNCSSTPKAGSQPIKGTPTLLDNGKTSGRGGAQLPQLRKRDDYRGIKGEDNDENPCSSQEEEEEYKSRREPRKTNEELDKIIFNEDQ